MQGLKIFIFLLSLSFSLLSQTHSKLPPLIIKGQLDNNIAPTFYISFEDIPGIYIQDTVPINEDGSFFFKTYKCNKPQMLSSQELGTYSLP